MKLFAKKSCSFGGKRFAIGDEVPADLVLNPATQERLGVLSIANDAPDFTAGVDLGDPAGDCSRIAIVLHAEEGDFPLDLTVEGLQNVVDVLTDKADPAKAIIEQMTDGAALILVDAIDSRASIKKAAQARAMALNSEETPSEEEAPEESEGEQ